MTSEDECVQEWYLGKVQERSRKGRGKVGRRVRAGAARLAERVEEPVRVVEAARLQRLVVRGEGLEAEQVVEHEPHRRVVRA